MQVMQSLAEMERRRVAIQKAYLVSCVNSRLEDLDAAAKVLKGKKVAAERQVLSRRRQQVGAGRSRAARHLADTDGRRRAPAAGRMRPVHRPRCRACWKKAKSASPRPIAISRAAWDRAMPSAISRAPKSSPRRPSRAISAARTIRRPKAGSRHLQRSSPPPPAPKKLKSSRLPGASQGRLVFMPQDNVNTDAIYGKDYTYRDDMTPEMMAKVVMENYDPQFAARTHAGDVIVSGFNFGTGSSREQAVTCLKAKAFRWSLRPASRRLTFATHSTTDFCALKSRSW